MEKLSVRSTFRSVLFLFVLLGGMLAGSVYWYKNILYQSGPHDGDVLLLVEPGDGHAVIRAKLARSGVINQIYHYDAARLIAGSSFLPKAGEFLLRSGASLSQIMAVIHQGYSYQRRLTVVEGLRSADITSLLNAMDHLTGNVERIPDEGSLFPDTYFYTYGTARQALLDRMQQAREINLAHAWMERAPNLPYNNPHEALIMASIIEMEASNVEERKLVAAVLVNRLRREMRLQSDPTVLYEMVKTPDPLPLISKQDLRTKTAWNTYVIKGLPKTPICNPGQESLDAALHPANSDYLYFVSDGLGGLRFAKTLDGHNRNVRLFRKMKTAPKKGQ